MKNIILIIAVALFSATNLIAGGPWTQLQGNGYFKLSEWWTVFDEHFTDSGQKDPNVTAGVFNTAFYAEYGVTNRFTTILNANLLSRNYMNNLISRTTNEIIVPGESINTLGDIDVGFKFGLTKQGAKIPVAVSLTLGLPTGTASGGTLNNLQTGDGEFNQILQIDAGTGFIIGKTPAYVSSYLGVNNRTENFSEELRYGAELGLGFFDQKFWLIGRLNIVNSFKNGATAASVASTSIFGNNTEFSSFGVDASLYITKRIGISAGAAGAFRGEIVAAAPSFNIGVFYDMK